jgi:hypothetical protein
LTTVGTLTSLTVSGNILPSTTTSNIGSSSNKFANIYATNLYLTGTKTAIDGTNNQYGIYQNSIFQPSTSNAIFGYYDINTFISPSTQSTNVGCIYLKPTFTATAGTITSAYGIWLPTSTSTGTITTGYGIKIDPLAMGTTRYGLYVDNPTGGASNYCAYFGGQVGINTTQPGGGFIFDCFGSSRFYNQTTGCSINLMGNTASGIKANLKFASDSGNNWIESGLVDSGGSSAPLLFSNIQTGGGGTIWMTLSATGRLGINSANPVAYLDIIANGNYNNGDTDITNGLIIAASKNNGDLALYMGADRSNTCTYIQSVKLSTETTTLRLNARGGNVIIGGGSGVNYVGINNNSPTCALDVLTFGSNNVAAKFSSSNVYGTSILLAATSLAGRTYNIQSTAFQDGLNPGGGFAINDYSASNTRRFIIDPYGNSYFPSNGVSIGYSFTSGTPPNNGLIVNGQVGIGTTSPATGTCLDMSSVKDKGMLLPSQTTTQRNSLALSDGLIVYDSDLGYPMYYSNILAAWTPMLPPKILAASWNTAGQLTPITLQIPAMPGYKHLRMTWCLLATNGGTVKISFNSGISGTINSYYGNWSNDGGTGIKYNTRTTLNECAGELLFLNNNIASASKTFQGSLASDGGLWGGGPMAGYYQRPGVIPTTITNVVITAENNAAFYGAGNFFYIYWEI